MKTFLYLSIKRKAFQLPVSLGISKCEGKANGIMCQCTVENKTVSGHFHCLVSVHTVFRSAGMCFMFGAALCLVLL